MKRILIDEGEMYIILVFMASAASQMKNLESDSNNWNTSNVIGLGVNKHQQYLRNAIYSLIAFFLGAPVVLMGYDVFTGSNKIGEIAAQLTKNEYHPPVPDKVVDYSMGTLNIKVISNPQGTIVHWWGQETQQVHGISLGPNGEVVETYCSPNPYNNAIGTIELNNSLPWVNIPMPHLEPPIDLDPNLFNQIQMIEHNKSPITMN